MCMLHAATHAWLSCFPCNLITKPFPWIQHACHALNAFCMEIGPACLPCFEFVLHCIGHIWSTMCYVGRAINQIACMCVPLSKFEQCLLHFSVNMCCIWLLTAAQLLLTSQGLQTKWFTTDQVVHQPHVQPSASTCGQCLQGHRGQWPRTHGQTPVSHSPVLPAWAGWEAKITPGQVLCHPDNRGGTMLNAWDVHRKGHLMMSVGINSQPPPWPKHGFYFGQWANHQAEAIW